ncbi:DNA mismatch repair protein MutS [Porphyromonas catoniae]|uniref:DNA mismatch repair protein MutS n=1 Tax=Porphyromonas catoniae ATCC 51270 TaxID=887901 RepID=Z4WQV8_9PORP|nr:DNA mismatch repair protein MutS [Porphyromonas catoniae]EWC91237.1 DNA mismatch repair protein MutS [Porphyromonas catoniae ATCC 51270]
MAKKIVETPLMKQYLEIKAKHPDAVLLFRVGDFYETFSEDAITASEILGITLTKRANGSAAHVELAGFPHHALDTYLPKLVRAGKRVAICDQLEDPKQTKKLVKRGITELVTPGVVLGDNVLKNKENNYLAAVYLTDNGLGSISLLDISTGEFLVSEGTNEHLDKLLSSYLPKEVLVERKARGAFDRTFAYRGFVFEVEDWTFAVENNRQKLQNQLGVKSLKGLGLENKRLSIASAGAILNYLELTSHNELGHITTLRSIDRLGTMRLDSFTFRSLEILQPMSYEGGKSLLDVLDATVTPMGGRLLRHWLSFPLIELPEIHRRQQVVAALVRDAELRRTLGEHMMGIGDLERMASKVALGRISPRETRVIAHSLRSTAQIASLLSKAEGEELHRMAERFETNEEVILDIERSLTDEPPIALGRGAVIASGINEELDELRNLSSHGKDYLVHLQDRESRKAGIPLKIAFNNVFGYYVEVRSQHTKSVPETWTRKQTLVGAERYIFPELKEYEEKILGAEERIAAIEARLYSELIARLSRHIQLLQRNARTLAELDCLVSFASCAEANRYVCPVVDEGTVLDIKQGRHPVIEKQLPFGESYVPNDVHLDQKETQIMVITGPNMSGKSALLRQTALITLLAQIGSFVPAEAAHIGLVDGIFTRVGASDNISRGESTFMVEMQEAASILNNLSDRSLILFDELGRGTSTYDGISIAWAIIEYLHDNRHGRPKTLFATHYHELNDLENRLERVKNFNVSAREIEGKMLFLRKLIPGGSEHSFGIQVARLGGMPQSITQRATEILVQLEEAHIHEVTGLGTEIKITKAKKPSTTTTEGVQGVQMSFFQLDDPVLSDIRERLLRVDINSLTPLEALNKLCEIQRLLTTPQ